MKTAFTRVLRGKTRPPVRVVRIRAVREKKFNEFLCKMSRTIKELAEGADTDPATAMLLRVLEGM